MFAYCPGIGQTVPLSAKAGFCAGKGIMTARGWRVRPFLAKVHRYAGLGMALFLIVSGLTGALLAFYHELDRH